VGPSTTRSSSFGNSSTESAPRTRGDWGLGRRVKPSTVSYSTAEAPSRGFVNAACCGVDAFRQRRVDVHRVRDVVGSRPEFDGEDEFVDDPAPCSPTMCAPSNSSVSAFVTSLTNPPFRRAPSACLGQRSPGGRRRPRTRFACFLFGQPDVADLRVGEHRPWDGSALGADFFAFARCRYRRSASSRAEWVNIGGPLTSPMA